jgi:hypothetical protein
MNTQSALETTLKATMMQPLRTPKCVTAKGRTIPGPNIWADSFLTFLCICLHSFDDSNDTIRGIGLAASRNGRECRIETFHVQSHGGWGNARHFEASLGLQLCSRLHPFQILDGSASSKHFVRASCTGQYGDSIRQAIGFDIISTVFFWQFHQPKHLIGSFRTGSTRSSGESVQDDCMCVRCRQSK